MRSTLPKEGFGLSFRHLFQEDASKVESELWRLFITARIQRKTNAAQASVVNIEIVLMFFPVQINGRSTYYLQDIRKVHNFASIALVEQSVLDHIRNEMNSYCSR